MGIAERREREREELRGRILDAAREMFAAEGYESVTMRAVADAIEYSPTTIYNHFQDKDDLVRCLCREDFSQLLRALEGAVPNPDPIEWIRTLGRAYARFGLENPNQYRFMFLTPAKPHHEHFEAEQSYAVLVDAVRRAVEAGRFRPVDVTDASRVLWSGLHGAISLLITLQPDEWPGSPPDPERLVDEVLDHGVRGYLAPGAG